MIVIPKDKGPDTGLYPAPRGKDRWTVLWTVDGKRRTRSFTTPDKAAARRVRDSIYADLLAAGAVRLGTPEHMLSTGRYIHRRPPFVVRISGTYVGEYETETDARTAVEKHLTGLKT